MGDTKAAAVLVVRDKVVLAVPRKGGKGWGLPGGRLEPGEDFAQAAARELQEETGLEAHGLVEVFDRSNDGWHCKTFVPASIFGDVRPEPGSEVKWISPKELTEGEFGVYNERLFKALGIPIWAPGDAITAIGTKRKGLYEEARDDLRQLLVTHGVKTGDFVLKSGRRSNWLVDCKPAVLTSEGHERAGLVLHRVVLHNFGEVDVVAGVELGGCPLASAVSGKSNWTQSKKEMAAAYVRKERKDHGSKSLVDCGARQGNKTVLLEDVVTTGGSSLRAVENLRSEGFDVVGIVALVDREEGGREAIEAAGLRLVSVFTASDLIVSPVMES